MTDHNRDRVDALTDLKYIGPATAEIIADADFDAADVLNKQVSYRMLVEAGTNSGVATKIRREHSLPWSITGSKKEDLDKRSNQVRGLKDEERAWVAASSGDWDAGPDDSESDESSEAATDESDPGGTSAREPSELGTSDDDAEWPTHGLTDDGTAEADGGGAVETAEAAWRERSKPDPVTEVDGVTEAVADRLANAGITSVRSLATADPESVSDVLGFDRERVAEWVQTASEMS